MPSTQKASFTALHTTCALPHHVVVHIVKAHGAGLLDNLVGRRKACLFAAWAAIAAHLASLAAAPTAGWAPPDATGLGTYNVFAVTVTQAHFAAMRNVVL